METVKEFNDLSLNWNGTPYTENMNNTNYDNTNNFVLNETTKRINLKK